jgi:Rieske Fe-S protein
MTDHEHQPSDGGALDRRLVLQGTALTGVAALLAACGNGGDASTTTGADGAASPTTESTPSTETTSSPSPSSAKPLTGVEQVPVGGGVIVGEVVVTQPEKGTFKAFTAICTHQGCTVDSVSDDVISCPCHGSQFSASDGAVVTGPAAAPLAEVPIEVKGGQVLPA